MAKRVYKTETQIKEGIANDIKMYLDAGLTVEDYVYDIRQIRDEYCYERGHNDTFFGFSIGFGIVGLLVGIVGNILNKKSYDRKVKQIEGNLAYRKSLLEVSDVSASNTLAEQGIMTAESVEAMDAST